MQRVGPYELLDEIGRGGFGAVYRARDAAGDRTVALKLLLRGASPPQRKRFQREAEALAKLSHPNLVKVHTVGEADGTPYMVMELVEGRSLEDRLAAGPLPPAEAADCVRQLAEGLAHAHGRGVLHRDVKPNNVILTPAGRAVLVDFGLTKDLDAGPDVSQLTRTGHALGTLGYLPPEQARGDRAAMSPASDVYGLGATLYALLTGEVPHAGTNLVELLAAAVNPVLPPSELQPWVDPLLERVCLACLELDPARRPTATALAERLLRWSEGTRARPPAWLLGAALALALVLGLTLLALLAAPAQEQVAVSSPSQAASPSATPTQERAMAPAPAASNSPPVHPASPLPARPAGTRYTRCLDAWGDRRGQTLGAFKELVRVGDRLLSAGEAGLRWWGAELGEPLAWLDRSPNNGVAVNPAGTLAVSCEAGVVRLWNLELGQQQRVLGRHTGWAEVVAFSPDGERALAGWRNGEGALRVWDVADGRLVRTLTVPGGVFAAVYVDSRRVLTGNGGGTIQEWDLSTGEPLRRFQVGTGAVFGLSVSPDRKLLLGSTWQDRRAKLWRLESGEELETLEHSGGVMQAFVLNDSRWIVSGGSLSSGGDWGVAKAQEDASPPEPGAGQGTLWALAIDPAGGRGWVGSNQGVLHRLDLRARAWVWRRRGHLGAVRVVAETSSGITSVGADSTLRVWGPTGELTGLRLVAEHAVDLAARAPDGAFLCARANGPQTTTLELGSEAASAETWGPEGKGARALAFESPNSGLIATSPEGLHTFLRDASGVELRALEGHAGAVNAVAVQASGQLAASGGEDGSVRLWDPARARAVATLRGHELPVRGVAFRPGRAELLSVGDDERLRRWDLASGECVAAPASGRARGIAAGPAGRLAATWDDSLVRLWDLERDVELDRLDLSPFDDVATAVAFADEGRDLLVGTGLGVVYRFELRTPK